jgi:DNA polymerase-3 subunit gamma/tau
MTTYYTKYRPTRFTDVLGQEQIVTILSNQVKRHCTANSYLFAGPSGSGKTTCARILANALAGSSWDIIELDGARFRRIDDVREMAYKANFAPLSQGKKVYIIDEAHALTGEAWTGLLKTLEDPPPYLCMILCTTHPEQIMDTIRSRCQLFEFQPVNDKAILEKLQKIVHKERMGFSNDALRFISGMSGGNMRNAESMLEQTASLDHGSPRTKDVKKFLQSRMV